MLAHAARDQLGVLRAEVEDQDAFGHRFGRGGGVRTPYGDWAQPSSQSQELAGHRVRPLERGQVAAAGEQHQGGVGDQRRHLELQLGRGDLVVAAGQDQGRAGDRRQAGAAVGAAHDGGLLAQEAVLAGVLGHGLDGGGRCAASCSASGWMNRGSRRGVTPRNSPLLGQLHQAAAAGRGGGAVGAGLGVEQGQAGDALGRLAQDLEARRSRPSTGRPGRSGRGGASTCPARPAMRVVRR